MNPESPYSRLPHAGVSDPGKVRKANEDAFALAPEQGMFVVADGVGGGEQGAFASRLVVDSARAALADVKEEPGQDNLYLKWRRLAPALERASRELYDHASNRHLRFCASTVVLLLFDANQPSRAIALHAGDSRLYRLRGSRLEALTTDHSPAAEWEQDRLANLPPRSQHRITRAIGAEASVVLHKTEIVLQQGDLYLLCSDGLHGLVPHDELGALLAAGGGAPDTTAARLVEAANQHGGRDNITAVLVKVDWPTHQEGELTRLVRPGLPAGEEDDTLMRTQSFADEPAERTESPIPESSPAPESSPVPGWSSPLPGRSKSLTPRSLAVAALVVVALLALTAALRLLSPPAPAAGTPSSGQWHGEP